MKITTVIPAYKSKYLFELLAALNHQTVLPSQVIFSDDSPDGSFAQILEIEPVKTLIADLNVSVMPGPRRGAHANWARCIDLWGGQTELLHVLCDDDIIYPRFYERHLQVHMAGNFSSTVSRRWYANETGQPVKHGLAVPEAISEHPNRVLSLDAEVMFSTTVGRAANWLGEVSNVVMRADCAAYLHARYKDGICFAGLEDLGSFILGTLHQPIGFINEHLGYFRQNAEQSSAQSYGLPIKLAHLAYIALAIIGRNAGKLTDAHVAYNFEIVGGAIMWNYRDEADMATFRALMPPLIARAPGAEERFLNAWEAFIQEQRAAGKT